VKNKKPKKRIDIHLADNIKAVGAKTYCGLSVFGPYKVCLPGKNIKTMANAVNASGGTATICIYCEKFGPLAELRDIDL